VIDAARRRGVLHDATTRQRIADLWIALRIMRFNALRSMTALEHGELTPLTSVHKLFWASLHRALGELAVDVLGADALVVPDAPYELDPAQRLFLWSRADTIYGGSNQVQRNVIGERALGLPPEPKV
jgi:alkylation response protein AidB-like acyl-CoA dehydrogenase